MTYSCEAAVIGGGLAGASLALYLADAGVDTTVFHQNETQGSCASAVPLALFNPAAALRAKLSYQAEVALEELNILIDRIQPFAEKNIAEKSGVFRPCLDARMEKNFLQAYEEEPWPDGWVEWYDKETIRKKFPGLTRVSSGLMVNAGMTVDTAAYLFGIHNLLTSLSHVKLVESKIEHAYKSGRNWIIQDDNGTETEAKYLIMANGYGIQDFPQWSFLRLHPVKGQALEIINHGISSPRTVSARGYLAFMDDKLVIGSTYEHHFSNLRPDEKGKTRLLKKLETIYPDTNKTKLKQWAGCRISTPDRLPYLGEHPEFSQLYIFNGLGSKGLMYSGYCASMLADFIINNKPVHSTFNVNRVK